METKTAFVLSADTLLSEAITAVSQGKLEQVTLVEWLESTRIPAESMKTETHLLVGVVDGPTFGRIMTKQMEFAETAGKASAVNVGTIRPSVSKRGCVSIYGINHPRPVTLYADQWRRLVAWLQAPEDNPLSKFIASKPNKSFDCTKDFKDKSDQEFLAKIKASPADYPYHKLEGDKLTVSLSFK